VLSFTVQHEDSLMRTDFMAQCAFPVSLLRAGYRVVPLEDVDGTPIEGFLFCRFQCTVLGR